ncbi:MAG: T9SS type A sorting domain-containing protein [Flavobacteriales bacterium]|nr:T9SS type A sorting domain-containing protein [Flavobacteriales bacterium]
MNKLYTSALALALVAGGATAQSGNAGELPLKKVRQSSIRNTPNVVNHGANREIIWSDDFSNPSTWDIGHLPSAFDLDWQIGIGLENTGSFPSATIESTTYDNGCAMFDSDGGNNTSGIAESAYITTASPIDLSGATNVVLSFESYFRSFNPNACYVVISTNNTDWPNLDTDTASWGPLPNVWVIHGDVGANQATDNPELVRVNISDIAGGESEVWVRFHYTGEFSYTWFVDDVVIEDLPENDMIMDYAFVSQTGAGDEYGRIPVNQFSSTMNVGAGITNFGYGEQTNVEVLMELRDASNNVVLTQSTTLGTLAGGATGMMDEFVNVPALDLGLYTATFTVTSDQSGSDANPDDNTFLRNFEVNNDVYSLDGIGNHPDGYERLDALGTASFMDDSEGLILFTYYRVRAELEVEAIQFELSNNTQAGSYVFVSIYDSLTVLDDNFSSMINQTIGASDDAYTITAEDISSGGTVTVPLSASTTLAPGGYYAAVTLYRDGESDITILDDITVPQPGNDGLLYIPSDATVYGNGNAHAVRFVMDASVSVNDVTTIEGVTMYPNPTNGILRINTEDFEKYNVEVINVLGELMMTTSFSGNTTLDLTGFAAGVYNVRLSNGNKTTVQRVTLN